MRDAPTKEPRTTDVRNYLRQYLYVAFDAMSSRSRWRRSRRWSSRIQALMDKVLTAVLGAGSSALGEGGGMLRSLQSDLFATWSEELAEEHLRAPLGALCWAVAVDTVLLDAAVARTPEGPRRSRGNPAPTSTAPGSTTRPTRT